MSPRRRTDLNPLLARLGLGDIGFVGKWIGISSVVGFVAGLAAVGFDWLTRFMHHELVTPVTTVAGEGLGHASGIPRGAWWFLLFLPLGGLVVGLLIEYIAPEAKGHGTEQMVHTFHQSEGRARKRIITLKAITSAITIGTGGSAGQEGPVAQIGGGVGSMISDGLKLSAKERRMFLLAGSSAGIGALFTAPLGGALFAPEVVYRKPEFEGEAIIPCIIASIVSYTTYTTISGEPKRIHIAQDVLDSLATKDPRELLVYFVLALLCTVVGWLYVRTFEGVNRKFESMRIVPAAARPAVGGLLLAGTALALAPFAGEHGILYGGYDLMADSIAGRMTIGVMAALVFGKILATAFSIATGGSGGVFAPSLAIGALLGATVGQTAANVFPSLPINPACYALVGMGGFFAGVAKTPISAILIVCEMTGSYDLLAPLMLVSVVHLLLAQRWTIYDTQVSGVVESPAHAGEFVVDVLDRMRVSELLENARKPTLVHRNTTLRRALDIVAEADGYYFPVVDDDWRMVGIFSLTDVRRIFNELEVADLVIVSDFMVDSVVTATADDQVSKAYALMNEYGLHELPIVDAETGAHVVAMLTRNNIGVAYSRRLHVLRRDKA